MKFSIRDLLLVTVIVALALGWWVDHGGQAARESKWKECANQISDALTDADSTHYYKFEAPGRTYLINARLMPAP
jgi:hypothetical protein